jgi:site-specific DNA-cytosine methylase
LIVGTIQAHGWSAGLRDDGCDNLIAATLNSGGNAGGFRSEPGEHIVIRDVQGDSAPLVCAPQMAVRRLTPTEAERLQAFPPGWTIPSHEHWKYTDDPDWPLLPKGLDSGRYRSLGNAVTVSVARWIGERILLVHGRKG